MFSSVFRSWLGARTWWSVLILAAAGASLLLPRPAPGEGDLFLHVLLGQWMLAGGDPAGNPAWTYAAAEPGWVNTLIVPELVFAGLYQVGGWGAVTLVRTVALPVLILATWLALSWLVPRLPGRNSSKALAAAAAGTCLLALLLVASSTIRPQTWSYPALVILTAVAARVAHTGRFPRWWTVALGTWAWTSWHGYGLLVAPVLGLAAFGYLVSRLVTARSWRHPVRHVLRQGLPALAAALGATLITPAGPGVYVSGAKLRELAPLIISEWSPTSLTAGNGPVLAAAVALWALVSFLLARRSGSPALRRRLVGETVLVTGSVIAFSGVERTAVIVVLMLVVLLTARIVTVMSLRWLDGEPAAAGRRSWLVSTGVFLLAGAVVLVGLPGVHVDPKQQPVALIKALASVPGDHRVFAAWSVSCATLLQLVAAGRDGAVAIDGRVDFYPQSTLLGFETLVLAQGSVTAGQWAPYSSSTDAIILSGSGLANYLTGEGWTVRGASQVRTQLGADVEYVWMTRY